MSIPSNALHAYACLELAALLVLGLAFVYPGDHGAAAAPGSIALAVIGAGVLLVGCIPQPSGPPHVTPDMSLALAGVWVP